MAQHKPRGRKHTFQLGPKGVAVHDLELPDTKPDIEGVVAKGWADDVEDKDPGIFDTATLKKLPEDNHDFSIRTSAGKLKYLQLAEFTGDTKFQGNYEATPKQHSASERFDQVVELINKKAEHYGDTKDVVLLIYITDFRFNFLPIVGVLGTRFRSNPPPFKRIYYVSVTADGSALVVVIHPFHGTALSEAEIRSRLGAKPQTPGPEDMTYG